MPTQVSLLDGALASAGTLAIQTNGTTSAITISSAQVATFVNNPIMTGLTASRAVFTDGSKGLTSNAITGTGNVVMSASPTLTGTIDGAALTLSSSLTLSGGTANGVLYLNGSKVATSGSALTFDGTTFGNTGNASFGEVSGSALTLKRVTSGNNIDLNFYNPISTAGVVAKIRTDGDGISNIYGALSFQTTQTPDTLVERYRITSTGVSVWSVAGTESMRLDSSGNLGIGTSSPAFGSGSGLEIERAGIATLRLENSSAGNNLEIYNDSLANGINFRGYNAAPMVFWTNNTERARIDSSGNFLVGATSGIASERLFVSGSNANYIERVYNSNASPYGIIMSYTGAAPNGTANEFLRCDDTGAARMSVRSNGGIANYQANNVNLSDRQEKTNFAPAGNYLAKICAIPVQTFNYIDQNMEEDGGLTLGVVAQDVQAVAPELVMESNWGTEEEPKIRLSIYQTDLQYALMKCIQEQQAIIESLKARLDAANL